MRNGRNVALLLVLCFGTASGAQDGPLFPLLFPQPTGRNGLEELVQASDLLRGAQVSEFARERTAVTLKRMREALQVPQVQQAVVLIRAGLSKQVAAVRTGSDADMRVLSVCRNLARVLSLQEYVLLADGRVSQALECFRDMLRLGEIAEQYGLLGSLTAHAMESISVRTLADHLDQMDAESCTRLRRIAESWVQSFPARLQTVLAAERASLIDRAGLGEGVDPRVASLLGQKHELVAQSLGTDPWKWRLPRIEGGGSGEAEIAASLWSEMVPVLTQVIQHWRAQLAMMQLLAVEAAVRRYRWEHDQVPDTLQELELGRLAVNPFTGEPLSYKRTGRRTFELKARSQPDSDGQVREYSVYGQTNP